MLPRVGMELGQGLVQHGMELVALDVVRAVAQQGGQGGIGAPFGSTGSGGGCAVYCRRRRRRRFAPAVGLGSSVGAVAGGSHGGYCCLLLSLFTGRR